MSHTLKKARSKNVLVDKSVYARQSDKQIAERIGKTQKLLVKFNLKAYAFDPGVCSYTIEGEDLGINFGYNEWKWLEPLLEELVVFRNDGAKQIKKVVARINKSCTIMDKEVRKYGR